MGFGSVVGALAVTYSCRMNDVHVLSAMRGCPPKELAISVYTGQSPDRQQTYCHGVRQVIKEELPTTRVSFFDHASPDVGAMPQTAD